MRYLNSSNADILLESETGNGAPTIVVPAAYLDASSKYDKPIYVSQGLVRQVAGTPIATVSDAVGDNTNLTIAIGRPIISDHILPSAADVAAFSGVTLVTSTAYTVWGRLFWKDSVHGATERSCDFFVTGFGTHGSGATFAVQALDDGTGRIPLITGSVLTLSTGLISLVMTGSGTLTAGSARAEVTYDYSPISPSISTGHVEAVFNQPATSERLLYVRATLDEGTANYATGSLGQVREHRVWPTGAMVGAMLRRTTYFYRDTANPTKPTNISTTMETVTAADLV